MFKWLEGFQQLENEIAYLEWDLDRCKSELKRWCNPLDLGRYSLTNGSKAAKLEDSIREIEWKMAYKMNLKHDLIELVYTFKGLDQHIMRMKYVEGLTLKEIANELGYGYTYIRKRHRNIINSNKLKNQLKGYKEGTHPIEKS